ncbi:cation:proton antiporter [Pseudodesulfovibrio sp. F-1]|uniref:Cation:proton antiporter n=2 Tax=Pseudodesulfovibrio alkaliphilus TaxID=2661613 RepID=A0A7K1KPQ8_9BACT|nr:cation:proton antiporter [Pseudodesulfovibrio alkaliphilus]
MEQMTDTVRVIRTGEPVRAKPGRFDALISFVLRFLMLFVTWLILSGMFDAFHVSLGVACSAFVTWLSADIFPPEVRRFRRLRSLWLLALYVPWLVWEIAKCNMRMLRLSFDPRLNDKIAPRIVTFKTGLRNELALTFLANSITMTPGTITVSIDERGYVSVHAFDDVSAAGLPGDMEKKIKAIFEEA